jgi:ABC-type nitrate/sulfonate/bicarbonate transport system substrate-binding protein
MRLVYVVRSLNVFLAPGRCLLVLVFLALIGGFCKSESNAAEAGTAANPDFVRPLSKPIGMRGAYVALSGSMWVPWIAKEGRLFDRYGLDVSLVYIGQANRPVEAMNAGSVDFLAIAGPTVLLANIGGMDITAVAGIINKPHQSIIVKPDIRSPKDLRGKRLMTGTRSSSVFFLLARALARWGLDPNSDVTIVSGLGGQPGYFAALSAGQVDGALLSEPTRTAAVRAGFKEIGKLSEMDLKSQSVTIAVTERLTTSNPDAVRRLVAAVSEAGRRLKADQAFALTVMTKYTRLEDRSMLVGSYETFAPITEEIPMPTADGIRADLESLCLSGQTPGACRAQPERFFQPRFVNELTNAGFYRTTIKR